jgi:hypothetical protein
MTRSQSCPSGFDVQNISLEKYKELRGKAVSVGEKDM